LMMIMIVINIKLKKLLDYKAMQQKSRSRNSFDNWYRHVKIHVAGRGRAQKSCTRPWPLAWTSNAYHPSCQYCNISKGNCIIDIRIVLANRGVFKECNTRDWLARDFYIVFMKQPVRNFKWRFIMPLKLKICNFNNMVLCSTPSTSSRIIWVQGCLCIE
jgi:hypothetical protein